MKLFNSIIIFLLTLFYSNIVYSDVFIKSDPQEEFKGHYEVSINGGVFIIAGDETLPDNMTCVKHNITDIQEGEYVFKFKAVNIFGESDETILSFKKKVPTIPSGLQLITSY